MKKYLIALVCCITSSFSMENNFDYCQGRISGSTPHLTFRSIQDGDELIIATLVDQCDFAPSFPEGVEKYAKNLIARQTGGNPYSGLMLFISGKPAGYLGFGRMTVLNYDPKHIDIIQTYLDFGVTKLVDPGMGFEKENIVRVDNNGLGFVLPILPATLDEEIKTEALSLALSTYLFLKEKAPLPIEKTNPIYLIGLFYPENPIVENFQKIGFSLLEKDGFYGYYDCERVMVYHKL